MFCCFTKKVKSWRQVAIVLVHSIGEVTCSCPVVFWAFLSIVLKWRSQAPWFWNMLDFVLLLETRMFVLNLWKFLAVSIAEEHHQVWFCRGFFSASLSGRDRRRNHQLVGTGGRWPKWWTIVSPDYSSRPVPTNALVVFDDVSQGFYPQKRKK